MFLDTMARGADTAVYQLEKVTIPTGEESEGIVVLWHKAQTFISGLGEVDPVVMWLTIILGSSIVVTGAAVLCGLIWFMAKKAG